MDNDRRNPNLHQLLGDIYFNEKDYEKTVLAYQQTLKINSNHVPALNNLAWLYATCENKNFRHPEKALELAIHAASLSEAPHILDTLAEAYYVNGNYPSAIQAEEHALVKAENDPTYYREQIKKFRAAGKNPVF